jgi:alpha-L-rhamnosidase
MRLPRLTLRTVLFSGKLWRMETTTTRPVRLRCEYLENPLGLDVREPRLSWQIEDPRRGARQTAYQVLVAGSLTSLNDGKGDLWDSGQVASDQSIHIRYAGAPLPSRQRCYWKVRTWDVQCQPSAWSAPQWWEMGLLERSDWKAEWIGSSIIGGPRTTAPAPFVRKEFRLGRSITSARLYVTALGLYEVQINGQRVGDDVFTPGRTEYRKRVPYQVYDVTSLLRTGDNAIGAILGDGWYCGHVHSDPRQYYGDRPRFLAQLVVQNSDGSGNTIVTDGSWKTSPGPILSNDLLMGEHYDARLEMPGWSEPGFDEKQWLPVRLFKDPGIERVAMRMPTVRRTQELTPIGRPWRIKRSWIFDLGQNMVGRVRLKVRGKPGQTITLRHAEMLDKDRKLYTEALRSALATDHYTLKSDQEEVYEPRFTFHGFRYVEVKGLPISVEPDADVVTGIVLHSDIPPTGTFECSDPMINQLQSNILWSQKGNFLEIPTDCPQRDERLGWTGDAQVFNRTAAFNMDVAAFFTKWLQDMADAQYEDGGIPSVIPFCPSIPKEGGPAWSDAAVICPWTLYLCYGDRRILEERYDMMTRFMGFLQASCPDHIRADDRWKWQGYGDWLSNNADTPKELIGTAFYAHCADLMSRIAGIIGRQEDARTYRRLFAEVRKAWQDRYITPRGLIIGQTQTAYVLALHFDLLPQELRQGMVEALVRNIEAREMHLSTGFVGTPYLPHVLTDSGRLDTAYALLNQKTCPSWLYPITQGATTMWERWDGWTRETGFNDAGMDSYNHYAYGAVGAWMYAAIAGIDLDPERPGFQHIIIRPHPLPTGGMTHARAALDSLYGRIESAWRIEGEQFHLKVTIPPNTTATVRLPAGNVESITEAGQPISKSEGVRIDGIDGAVVILDVVAGRYAFRSSITGH